MLSIRKFHTVITDWFLETSEAFLVADSIEGLAQWVSVYLLSGHSLPIHIFQFHWPFFSTSELLNLQTPLPRIFFLASSHILSPLISYSRLQFTYHYFREQFLLHMRFKRVMASHNWGALKLTSCHEAGEKKSAGLRNVAPLAPTWGRNGTIFTVIMKDDKENYCYYLSALSSCTLVHISFKNS